MLRRRHLALGALALVACTSAAERGGAVGEFAPRITGKDLAGEYVALEDHRGEVVLLNLWATWCAPCRAELPALERLHRRFQGRGFTVLGVSVDSERSEAAVRAMVREVPVTYPVLLDPAARAAEALGATGYPTSILVGRDGVVRWRSVGALRDDDPGLLAAIEAALGDAGR
ncbi:MAG: TlpA family protein disulfide reductase [Myxococcales bacterium]|nr:TlpA family protein disulfide reductase [Myxococcales bacterium]